VLFIQNNHQTVILVLLQAALRALLRVQVGVSEAAAGARPDIYWPSVIRSDSEGNIILLEHGFGQIRRLSPRDHTAVVLATVDQKFWVGGR
jgi:hypothetical protein